MSWTGLATLREGPTASRTSPGDSGEEQPVMMSRKKHVVDGQWATQSRSVVEQKSEKLKKNNRQHLV
jgi:hypothetical protein